MDTLLAELIARYRYDLSSDSLVDPMEVLAGLPGSTDHNSGRLLIGPDEKIYYPIGDQGNNQYANWCLPIEAQRLPTSAELATQDWSAYQGKVLRIELDGTIPADNPVIDGVRSHVWTYGHRNAQGLAFAVDGALFEAEHGPESDDEVNRLEPGRNYGLPQVAGFQDDQAYAYANWSASVDTPFDNADGTILYVATDVAGNTLGDDGFPTDVLVHPGAILALTTGD